MDKNSQMRTWGQFGVSRKRQVFAGHDWPLPTSFTQTYQILNVLIDEKLAIIFKYKRDKQRQLTTSDTTKSGRVTNTGYPNSATTPRPPIQQIDGKQSLAIWIKRIAAGIWLAACFLGMLYHMEDTTSEYLRYPMTTEVAVALDYNFTIPAAAVCINPVSLLNTEKLCDLSGNNSIGATQRCYFDIVLLNESLKDLTDKLIKQLVSKVVNEDGKLKMRTYFKKFVCLDIVPVTMRQTLSAMTGGDAANKAVYKIDLDFTGIPINEFTVSLHYPALYPRGIDIKTLELLFENEVRTRYTLGSVRVRTKNLPSPFESKCIEYTSEKEESSQHCIDKCINEQVKKSSGGKYHPEVLLTKEFYRDDVRFINSSTVDYSALYSNCLPKCPIDCETTSFFLRNMDDFVDTNDHLYLSIDFADPGYAIKYLSRLDLSSYLIYMGSILGLWFGLSFHSTVESSVVTISHAVQKVKSRRKH